MTGAPAHLLIAPILIPLVAGALMLLYDDRQRRQKRTIALVSAAALLLCAIELTDVAKATDAGGRATVELYLLGNWPPPSPSCWCSTGSRR